MSTSLLNQAEQDFQRLESSLSPATTQAIQDRLLLFKKVSHPKKSSSPTTLVLVRRPGLPPRPLSSTYFICHTPS